jgi:hypothetical protein
MVSKIIAASATEISNMWNCTASLLLQSPPHVRHVLYLTNILIHRTRTYFIRQSVCLDRFPHWNLTITAAKLYAHDRLYCLSFDKDSVRLRISPAGAAGALHWAIFAPLQIVLIFPSKSLDNKPFLIHTFHKDFIRHNFMCKEGRNMFSGKTRGGLTTFSSRDVSELPVLLRLLRRMRKNGRRRRLELWTEQTWLHHHDNAPSHTSVQIQLLLEKH